MNKQEDVMELAIKRVYETPEEKDGFRILVDRLWPRGMKKEKAQIDLWLKDIAPTNELRKWFGHDADNWEEFQKRYTKELENNKDAVSQVKNKLKEGKVTLIYGAKDKKHNQAVVLKDFFK